jgi:glycosyltransferase involved in cell wall biosynthesis
MLLRVARRCRVPLRVCGDGPLRPELEAAARECPWIEVAGTLSAAEILQAMDRAKGLLFPSQWYEGFPLVLAEALSRGLPVIASRLGGIPDVVRDGQEGCLLPPGDEEAWAGAWTALDQNAMDLAAYGANARARYLARYTPARNLETLLEIYHALLQ